MGKELLFVILLFSSCMVLCRGQEQRRIQDKETLNNGQIGTKQNSAGSKCLPPTEEFEEWDYSDHFQSAVNNNKRIAEVLVKNDQNFFKRHVTGQAPKFMWIGCSDSRVIPEKILGLEIGEVFVHRNVANQANPVDQNMMSALEYAIEYLNVETLIIAGHYECGGIKASLTNKDFGHLQSWLSQIRELRYQNSQQLSGLSEEKRLNRLIQINVEEQVRKISRIPLIQKQWKNGKHLEIVGVVYDIKTGLLHTIAKPVNGLSDIPENQEFIEFLHESH